MFVIPTGIKNVEVSLITDENYFSVVKSLLNKYRKLVWTSIFIIDLNTSNQNFMKVHELLVSLKNAEWEGSDVKLIVSGSKTNLSIANTSLAASYLIDSMQLPYKILMTKNKETSHVKMLIIDDMVILGSHNWSPGSFGGQTQDSVLVKSKEFSAYCQLLFKHQWFKNVK